MKECISIKTDYSPLSSIIKVPDLLLYAKDNNINTLGIVDDNLSASIEFILGCESNNIRPIIGLHSKLNDKDIYLYAKDEKGLHNLFKLNTYLLDNELSIIELSKYINNFLIVIPYEYNELFGELNKLTEVFIGYKNGEEKTNALLITDKIIYFNLALSITKEDTKYINYIAMVKENDYDNYQNRDYSNNYIKCSDLSDFTNLINIKLSQSKNLIPHYDDNIKDSYKYLEALSIKGLNKRLNGEVPDNYKKRLLYELSIIKRMSFTDYFLIVYDYVKYARNNNILVGAGRGSAAGSLVTYSLGITMVDPIKYGLLFERFLNPERITMPDIDIDFDASKRGDMIEYVKSRYGQFNVMPIMTYGTFASKQALLSVSKILNVDISKLSKYIDAKKSLRANLTKEVIDIINHNKDIKKVYYEAFKLEGLKKHISTHAAGVVICKEELDNIIPIIKSGNVYLTGYTMNYLEGLGLLKMDFLAIKDLTTIADILKEIPDKIDINKLDLNIPEVLNNFTIGSTTGIFQFESEGMKNFLSKLKPKKFEDLVIALALYRPGPMDNIPSFIKRMEGKEKVDYIVPALEPILKDTFGIIVYQEQIMQIFNIIGGYSVGEADVIRRAISKKKEKIILEEKEKFIKRARDNGYSVEISTKIYNYIMKFANYGFNKSHSVAYAMIAYQMMFLKVKYPEFFYTALLNININSVKKTKEYLDEVRLLNINIIKPDINISKDSYYINNGIVMPLSVINNIGEVVAGEITKESEKEKYLDFFDFVTRVYGKNISVKTIECLISAGALDSFGQTRKTLIENIKSASIYAELASGLDSSLVTKPSLEICDEYPLNEIMQKEYDAYGFYISNHPVSKYNCPKIINIKDFFDKTIDVYVLLEKQNTILTKNGDSMAFIKVSDETGTIEGIIFPKKINYINYIKMGDILKINGQVQKRLDKYQIVVNKIEIVKN